MMKAWMLSAAGAALALGGCGKSGTGGGEGKALTGSQKVEAIASTLQACSYEGKPVTTPAADLGGAAPSDCSQAVNRIMGYTGLPANFVVVSGPVDNAAAVILLDDRKIPRRVIAFNPQFMSQAAARVGGDPWGPISIMAHEIAHHLSGHTIVPGGSRPEIELEADKFSGFVLQKMGAPLADATKMILTIGTDHGSPTHPGKQQRADAIRQGWEESLRQSGGTAPTPSATPSAMPSAVPVATAPRVLPQPGSIPFKYGRFVIDETGKLDPAITKAMEAQLFSLARDVGAEFTVLVVNDLKGMSAQDYAWAMMRQLRVGKLDVGNGAVVVVAPRQRQAAVAFGPGLAKEAEFSNPEKQLLGWIDNAWPYCDDADGCKQWTDALFFIFNGTLTNAKNTKWTIDYPSLSELVAHYDRVNTERVKTKRPFDPRTDQPIGNLIRVSGKITRLGPQPASESADGGGADARLTGGKLGYTAVSMVTDDGYPVTLYVSPRLAPLMPSGRIKADTRYTVVGRLQRSGDKASGQPAAMWLFSYDAI